MDELCDACGIVLTDGFDCDCEYSEDIDDDFPMSMEYNDDAFDYQDYEWENGL